MELENLIEQLGRPDAYPHGVDGDIVVCQTHISVVFLVDDYAYKLKKPVDLGFVDYGTLEKREHFCRREVELNRRLAPHVYLDVVPVTQSSDGELCLSGEGEVVEWAVKMARLPDEATLEGRLERGEVTAGQLETLARRLADFHAEARGDEEVAQYGRFEVVAGNARDNFGQSEAHRDETIDSAVFARLRELNDAELQRRESLIERRAEACVPRDTHGDLRLDHVYFFSGRDAPEDVVIVDCIEFNDRFRYADPVADVAFLVMDLAYCGRRDLARAFAAAYVEAADDRRGSELLRFYVAYRAAVRGKVEGIKATAHEVAADEREQARKTAAAHWLLALDQLEEPARRPALLLIGGLPGTGKSTVARALAERAGFEIIDTDRVRKELAGLDADQSGKADFGEGIYTGEWSDKTYAECLGRAEQMLFEGKRVIVDATFNSEARRRTFLAHPYVRALRSLFIVCETSAKTARERLSARSGDVSDADWDVYARMADGWDDPSESTERRTRRVSTEGPVEQSVERVLGALREGGLVAQSAS